MKLFRSRRSREKEIEEKILASGNAPDKNQSYWSYVKRQFKKNRLAVISLYIAGVMAFVALFADFIANEKPIVAKYQDNWYFPVLKEYAVDLGISKWQKEFLNVDWAELEYDFVIWPPVPYLPQNLDWQNDHFVSPLEEQDIESWRWTHWLGTDELGRDVLAGMIHGTRTAFLVGIISMGIASIIGIFLGALAGYYGDDRLQASRIKVLFWILFFILGVFYAFGVRSYILGDAISESLGSFFYELLISLAILIGIFLIGNFLAVPFKRIPFLGKQINVPVDIMVTRLIEILVSIPRLILIMSIVATITKPSVFIVMAIIGLTSWTGIARFTRAELLKVRKLEFIEAAHSLGYSEIRTMFKHALPNALSPVFIAIAFGVAAAILIESTLSFLGIGVAAEEVTWGSLLQLARSAPEAWWLAICPGVAIFITVTIFNLIGEGLTDAIDPRLKQ